MSSKKPSKDPVGPQEDNLPIEPQEDIPLDEEALPQDTETEELAGQQLCFRVGQNLKFRRLDQYLTGRFSNFSRTKLQQLIKEQGVNVNGHPAKPSYKLNPGDQIDLILPPRELRELIPEDIPLHIIYEDDDVVVVNKQADLIVHPARGCKHGTLVNALVYHYQKLSQGS